MIKVVGIRFQKAGKIYYFDPCDFELETGMHAIVETARGVEMGTVLIPPKDVEDEKVIQPLKPVIRVATDEDEQQVERNREREKEAFAICKEKILKHELEMKLINAEYTFDNNKLLFYFTADGRIDFRELVKDLAAVFRTRIELRQIGVRDETKILGGIGICGRPLCCKTYLADFVPVSIKMAKEQNLSLNPTKISGVCGRLMCCLKNEQETYEYLNSRLPSVGDYVYTKAGEKGEVQSVSVLRQLVKVVVDNGDEKELREYKIEELNFRPKKRKDVKITEEELKELEGLEDDGVAEETAETKPERPKRNFNRDNRKEENRKDRENNYSKRENRKERENNYTDREPRKERENNYTDREPRKERENNYTDRESRKERENNYTDRESRKERENNYADRESRKERDNNYVDRESRKERENNYADRENRRERNNYKEREPREEQVEGSEQAGENRPYYKKRYDGKGKRYFGKNKKRNNNSSEE